MAKLTIKIDLQDGDTIPEGKLKEWALSMISPLSDENCKDIAVVIGQTSMLSAISWALIQRQTPDELVEFDYQGNIIKCCNHYPEKCMWEQPLQEILMDLF